MTEFQAENKEQLSYLLGELSKNEREAVEERMFADEDFFADLLELENDLVDAYVGGGLSENVRLRFEKSLNKFSERREKIKNAAALREFIRLENDSSKVSETVGFWERIRAFFAGNAFGMKAVFAGLLILLTIGTAYLLYDRYRLNSELAELKNKQDIEQQQKESELQDQLNAIREREENLQKQLSENQTKLDNSQEQTENLQNQIEREQAEKERLEKELEDLRRKRPNNIPESPKNKVSPPQTVFASVLLSPIAGSKGGGEVGYLNIGKDVSSVRLTLQVPAENTAKKFSVSLNGAKFGSNVNLRNGRLLVVNIPASKFKMNAENRITATAVDGGSFDYYLVIERL
jgi:TolA-binding protein